MTKIKIMNRISFAFIASLATAFVAVAENNARQGSCYSIGPDVVSKFWDTHDYGSVGDISAFAIGTDACNIGDEILNWEADNENHPVISTSVYRLKNNRFEQVGLAWLKHGFGAANTPDRCDCECIPDDYQHLGVGCADAYGATTNGYQPTLAPRSDVNGFTGHFVFPPEDWGSSGDAIFKRLQVNNADLESNGAGTSQYFGEIQYVSAHDSLFGNQFNNSTWQPISFTGAGNNWSLVLSGEDHVGDPVLKAWGDLNPSVRITESTIPGDGAIITAALVTEIVTGWYQYEYAIQNVNAHRGVRNVEIELPLGGIVYDVGFKDITYHSKEDVDDTDWTISKEDTSINWSTESHIVNFRGNAIRWGTTYNFRFISNVPPADGAITLLPFRSNFVSEEPIATRVPNLLVDPCLLAQSPCPTDVTSDGIVDVADLLVLFDWWGDCGDGTYRPPADATGDCCVNINDMLAVIGDWGQICGFGGACCLPDGTCQDVENALDCEVVGGSWNGILTTCNSVSCDNFGACCFPDSSCQPDTTNKECTNSGGIWNGLGSNCLDIICSFGADNCEDAPIIEDGLHSVDTTYATTDGPNHAECKTGGDSGQTGNDIWFHYIPVSNGQLTVSTCEQVGGSANFDTDLVIYDGADCENLVLLDCDDDNSEYACGGEKGGWHSNLVVPVTHGSSYLIRLGGWQEGHYGNAELLIELK
jgi:hypothetical protein